MPAYSGFDGYVALGTGQVIGRMNRWTISASQDTIDVSSFKPGATGAARRFREFIPGPLGWTATFDGFVDPTDPGQQALKTAIEDASILTFYFHLSGSKYLVGKGILTSEDFEHAWDAAGTVSYDVQGSEMLMKVGWE